MTGYGPRCVFVCVHMYAPGFKTWQEFSDLHQGTDASGFGVNLLQQFIHFTDLACWQTLCAMQRNTVEAVHLFVYCLGINTALTSTVVHKNKN